MPAKRSADSAVYKRPLSGGEAIDDDVEGHSMVTHASGGPKLHAAGGPKLHAAGGPKLHAAGAKRSVTGDDDDVEGHAMGMKQHASPKLHAAGGPKLHAKRRAVDDGDDVEGHSKARRVVDDGPDPLEPSKSKSRPRASEDGDTEGHAVSLGGGGGLYTRAKPKHKDDHAPKPSAKRRAIDGDEDVEGHSKRR